MGPRTDSDRGAKPARAVLRLLSLPCRRSLRGGPREGFSRVFTGFLGEFLQGQALADWAVTGRA